MKIIETDNAPKAIGTYSQAVKVNGFLFISGQIPLDPSTMELVEGIENQINQVFENINQILKADGMDFSNVVKLSVLLEDLSHFAWKHLWKLSSAKVSRPPITLPFS